MPSVAMLPAQYPDSWISVQDLFFDSIIDGRASLIDVTADNRQVKGQVPVAQFGTLIPSTTRPEIYVAETFHARQTRGERTDVITIWDKVSLTPKAEIVLPGGKRGQFVTLKNTLQLTNGEKWGLVFNFTPGASVTVVDLVARTVLGDIDIPGCSLVYPTGARGFTSLCADGTMATVQLEATGKLAATVSSKAFNDIDKDAMFMTPAMIGRTAWFATFAGSIQGLDLSGDVARIGSRFALPAQPDGKPQWRPGGWQVITADAAGLLYVLMSPAGKEGSHKDGGDEVWVVNPATKALVRRIALANHAISVETTQQARPLLVAARADGALDVYDAATGKLQRTVIGSAHDPMTLTAVR